MALNATTISIPGEPGWEPLIVVGGHGPGSWGWQHQLMHSTPAPYTIPSSLCHNTVQDGYIKTHQPHGHTPSPGTHTLPGRPHSTAHPHPPVWGCVPLPTPAKPPPTSTRRDGQHLRLCRRHQTSGPLPATRRLSWSRRAQSSGTPSRLVYSGGPAREAVCSLQV